MLKNALYLITKFTLAYSVLVIFPGTAYSQIEPTSIWLRLDERDATLFGGDSCGVELSIGNIDKIYRIAESPDWVIKFPIPNELKSNQKVFIKPKGEFFGARPCKSSFEYTLNDLIRYQWIQVLEGQIFKPFPKDKKKLERFKKCLPFGSSALDEKFDLNAEIPELMVTPLSQKGKKLISGCLRISELKELASGQNCELKIDAKNILSQCDEVYFSTSSPNVKLTFESASEAAVLGQEIEIGFVENELAQQQRFINENRKRELAAEEAIRQEQRRRWLETPEGKKYLAEEEVKRKKTEETRKRAEAEEKLKIERDFPYYAVIFCGIQNQHFGLVHCFAGDFNGRDTQLELTNGKDYNLYQHYDMMTGKLWKPTTDGNIINLRQSFELRAQNASKDVLLGVKIINRRTDAVVFEKKVGYRGVISINIP